MAYTLTQLRQIIYLNIIDNVSEEIDPEDLRLTLNAIAESIFEQVSGAAAGFYFGPWISQPYKVGWIAISTDGTKLWRALQEFNSATEPSANSAYWKLIAQFPAAAQVNQLQTDLTTLQEELVALKKTVDGLQVPPAPDGAEWSIEPKITVEGTTIKAMNAARALWNNVPVDYPVGDLVVATKPVYPLKRVDLVAVYEDGTYTVEPGVESEGSPVQPALPAGALYATFVLWTSSGGTTDTSGYDALNQRLTAVESKYVSYVNGQLLDKNGFVIELGTSIESTDDIASEGTANLWFKEARVLATKLTGYLKQGTTRALATTDNFLMALGILENRIDGKQNQLTFDSTPTTGSSNPVTSGGIKTYVDTKAGGGSTWTVEPATGVLLFDKKKMMGFGTISANLHFTLSNSTAHQLGGEIHAALRANGSNTVYFDTATMIQDDGSAAFITTNGVLNYLWFSYRINELGQPKVYYNITQPAE